MVFKQIINWYVCAYIYLDLVRVKIRGKGLGTTITLSAMVDSMFLC